VSLAPIASFDELEVGQRFDFGTLEMTREEILDFGRRFDPQPSMWTRMRRRRGPSAG
jgi:hypothetical protein